MKVQRDVGSTPPGIGDKLKTFRKERKLSIRVLAERAGLSPNTITLIENNNASPTVTTLHSISNALDIPLSAFFIEDTNGQDVYYFQAQEHEKILMPGLKVSVLPRIILDQRVHALQFTVEAGKGSGNEQMVHPGEELVICTRGELEYRVNDTIYQLKEQDSLAFDGSNPHSFFNRSQVETHFLVLITTETDQSFRFHLQSISLE